MKWETWEKERSKKAAKNEPPTLKQEACVSLPQEALKRPETL